MYKIYADNTLIYDSTLEDYKIAKGTVSLEVDKSGSFDFSVYPDHFFYDKFVKLKTLITVHRSEKILFRGRILNDVTDYWNNKAIKCEGELGFFNDSIIRPFTFKGTEAELLQKFIDEHNAGVDDFKRFKVGTVTVSDDIVEYSNKNYDSTFKNMTTYLNRGHFVITHGEDGTDPIPTLNYLSEFTKVASQKVEFGSNLKNYTKTAKAEDIATAIIPYATVDGVTLNIKGVNNGVDYVYSEEAVALYGWVFKAVNFDGVTGSSALKTKAEEYIKDVINQNITVDLNAIDLHLLDKSIESFNIGDYIQVTSEPHNFNATLLCNKQTIDLLKPENDSLVLGYPHSTLTGTTSQVSTKVEKIEEEIENLELDNGNTGGDGDGRHFELETITEKSAQISLYGFTEGDEVRIFLRLTNEVDGLYDKHHTVDFSDMTDDVFDVNFTGLPSDTDFVINVKFGGKWLGAQTFKTRGGARSFEIETITESSASISLYNFMGGDEARVFLRLNNEVDGLYDEYHTINAEDVTDNKFVINFKGLPSSTDFAVNVKYGDNWLGAQTFRTIGGEPYFELYNITEETATFNLYNVPIGEEVRIFVRLANATTGIDQTYEVTDEEFTIKMNNLRPNTEFVVNMKYGDNWLGAQTFKTKGGEPYFEIVEITSKTVELDLYNVPVGEEIRVFVRLLNSTTGIDQRVTVTDEGSDENVFHIAFSNLQPNYDLVVNIQYDGKWLGAQPFRTKSS